MRNEVELMEDKSIAINSIMNELVYRYPCLSTVKEDIYKTFQILIECFESKHKLLIAGNGGSAADAEHIVGELMKGFKKARKIPVHMTEKLKEFDEIRGAKLAEKLQEALPAIALSNHSALNTAYSNDVDAMLCFAQQVYGYGNPKDVLLAISTSGNSENIINSVIAAKAKGLKIIALTGKTGGLLKNLSDAAIVVPEEETYKIQELHLPIYHALCLMLEEEFFN